MHAVSKSSPTFAGSLARATPLVKTVAVVLGTLFVAAAAQIEVPFVPVPMTMQTFAVLTVGLLFGWRFSGLILAAYLAEGAAGLPVFHGGGSLLTILAQPSTAGYLVGFLVGAPLAGLIAERLGRRIGGLLLAAFIGDVALFSFGIAFLATMVGVEKAFAFGLVPFLPGEALKIALAVTVAAGAGRLAHH